MAKLKKSELKLMDINSLCKLIKEDTRCDLTKEEICTVFKIYKDIVLSTIKDGDTRVTLPFIGQFFVSLQKGKAKYSGNFGNGLKYHPPEGDCFIPVFEFNKKLKETFKENTRKPLDLTKEELEQAKREAEERLKKNG